MTLNKTLLTCLLILSLPCVVMSQNSLSDSLKTPDINIRQVFKPVIRLDQDDVSIQKYNSENLPIFCKMEYKFNKSSNINLRFRLGSLDYVNMLEKKPTSGFYRVNPEP
ncbi:MAG: hypothetical protein J5I52_07895 [Saprospiraceae bacterium]|nr:hypothetical protein [Saprospiraceae bacterium]